MVGVSTAAYVAFTLLRMAGYEVVAAAAALSDSALEVNVHHAYRSRIRDMKDFLQPCGLSRILH